jgi:uncharacterized phage protein (TIGR01671 family)
MREIKFRAWVKRHNKMFNLDSLKWSIDNKLVVSSSTPEDLLSNVWFAPDELDDEKNVIHIMQYTGLKDKNGKEIYEGDIVKYILGDFYENTGKVVWLDESNFTNFQTYPLINAFVLHSIKYKRTDTFQGNESEFLEVIGNIYESNNLLESDEK